MSRRESDWTQQRTRKAVPAVRERDAVRDTQELRHYLERAIPRLTAPERRLAEVRRRVVRRRRRHAAFAAGTALAALVVASAVGLAACGPLRADAAGRADALSAGTAPSTAPVTTPPVTTTPAPPPPTRPVLAGLGPRTLAEVPANARQVLVVSGAGRDASTSTAVLYRRDPAGDWRPGTPWAAHNADHGWTDDHHAGDLRSPIGVFTLTDAGGRLSDPGTKLPYDRSPDFSIGGTGFEGEPLAGSFDYVVAVNYNRTTGTSPLDRSRPLGAGKGGGIWLHVDHGGPTHGCVSLSEAHLRELLRALDPADHPVVVMGDAASLAR